MACAYRWRTKTGVSGAASLSPSRLFGQHLQRLPQAGHAVPAQFHVVVQATTDGVGVRIVQPRNDTGTVEIDDYSVWSRRTLLLVIDTSNQTVLDGQAGRVRAPGVQSRDAAITRGQIGMDL